MAKSMSDDIDYDRINRQLREPKKSTGKAWSPEDKKPMIIITPGIVGEDVTPPAPPKH